MTTRSGALKRLAEMSLSYLLITFWLVRLFWRRLLKLQACCVLTEMFKTILIKKMKMHHFINLTCSNMISHKYNAELIKN